MTNIRIKFVIKEEILTGNKKSVSIENNAVNIAVEKYGVHIQTENDNMDLPQFKNKGGDDRSVYTDIKNLRILLDSTKNARKIYNLLQLKNKLRDKSKKEYLSFIIEKIDYSGGLELDDVTKTL